MLAPHLAVQLLARDDPVPALHERREQLQLANGEMEPFAVDQHQELARTNLELAGPQRRSLQGCLHAAEGPSIVRNLRYLHVSRL